MGEIILSIIVPVYNVEKFLRKCVESLEVQDLSHDRYEVILVDDGSTDSSGKLCDELAKDYSNISVIHQYNQGLSVARNVGMDRALGQYLFFVDSDDYVEENSIGKVVSAAVKEKADLCFFRYEVFNEKGCWPCAVKNFPVGRIFTGENLVLHGLGIASVWCNIYRAEYIRSTGVRFHPGILHQDVDFNMMVYPLAQRVVFTDVLVYHYNRCQSNESLTNTRNVKKLHRSLMCDVIIADDIMKYCKTAPLSPAVKRLYRRRMRSQVVATFINVIRKPDVFDFAFLDGLICKLRELDLYPIWGRTSSWKTTMLELFINCPWVVRKLSERKV